MKKDSVQSQHGFFLIELMVAIAILGLLSVWFMQDAVRESENTQAKQIGKLMVTYVNATRGYLSDNAAAIAALATPVTYASSSWLKSTSCPTPGTAAKAYLPCDFPDTLPLGVTLSATKQAGIGGRAEINTKTSVISVSATTREDLAGVATMAANGEPLTGPSVLSNIIATRFTHGTGANAGRVLASVSNAPTTDAWLRTDGSNAMAANLNMGGNSITGAANISASGNISTTGGNITTDNGFIRAKGDGTTRSDPATGSTYKTGDIAAYGGDVVAKPISSGGFFPVPVGGNLLSVGGNVIAKQSNITGLTGLQGGDIFTENVFGWREMSVAFGNNYTVGTAGVAIPRPTCRPGTTPWLVASVKRVINPFSTLKDFYVSSSVSGNNWILYIYARDLLNSYVRVNGTVAAVTRCI